MEHFSFLWAAYSIIFVVIFLYIVFIRRRQNRIEATINLLEARLAGLDAAFQQKHDYGRVADRGLPKG